MIMRLVRNNGDVYVATDDHTLFNQMLIALNTVGTYAIQPMGIVGFIHTDVGAMQPILSAYCHYS